MIFESKKKEQPLILYEKFKYDHHLNRNDEIISSKEKIKIPMTRRLCNLLVTCILLAMIFLSAVGMVVLINPQMREMLEIVIGL